ncbi:MAG: response regulator [Bacteroidetes bacterium]|nr:response regulator [Bacteroidota bacterium]
MRSSWYFFAGNNLLSSTYFMRFLLSLTIKNEYLLSIEKAIEGIHDLRFKQVNSYSEFEEELSKHYYSIVVTDDDTLAGLKKTKQLMPHVHLILLCNGLHHLNLSEIFNAGVYDIVDTSDQKTASDLLTHRIKKAIDTRVINRMARMLNAIILNYPAEIIMTRSKNGSESHVVFANNLFLQENNIKLHEIVGKELNLEKEYAHLHKNFNELQTGTNKGYSLQEIKEITPLGKTNWYNINILYFTDPYNQSLKYTFLVKFNITNEKKKENQLKESKSKTISEAKSQEEFLAFTAHEIRKPLNNIVGLLDMLKSSHEEEKKNRAIAALEQSSKGLNQLINDLLNLFQSKTGTLTLKPSNFNLIAMLNNVVESFSAEAKNKAIELTLSIDSSVPINIYSDENRIQQVIINLIGNAIKFTTEGSVSINVTAQAIKRSKHLIRLEIIDTGIGIDKKGLDKIFKSFSQANSQIKLQFGGTGLGLAITKNIISLLKGDIQVKSTLGKGTTFTVEFPVVLNAIDESLKKIRHKDLEDQNILVVDDNDMNLMVLSKLIEDWGATATTLTSGQLAIDEIKNHPSKYQLVLMDIQMPGLNGIQTSKQIKEIAGLPILALYAFRVDSEFTEEFDEHLDDLLLKPINSEDLYQKIKLLIEANKMKQDTPQTNNFKTIDDKKIRKFAGNDPVFMKQLIDIFLKRTPEYITELKTAIDQQDWDYIKMMAHKLKPTFTYVGLEHLTQKVGSIEDFAIKKDIMTIHEIMEDVWDECQSAFGEFKSFRQIISAEK